MSTGRITFEKEAAQKLLSDLSESIEKIEISGDNLIYIQGACSKWRDQQMEVFWGILGETLKSTGHALNSQSKYKNIFKSALKELE